MHSHSLDDTIITNDKPGLSEDRTINIHSQLNEGIKSKGVSSDNIFFALKIKGKFDELAINLAFKLLIKKNTAFRSNFQFNGNELKQIINPSDCQCYINYIDNSDSLFNPDIKYLEEFTQKTFDLENDSLLRINIIINSSTEFILLATSHKMVCDLYSLEVLLHQFCEIYPHIIAGRKLIVSENLKAFYDKKTEFSKKYVAKYNFGNIEPLAKYLTDRFTGVDQKEIQKSFSNFSFKLETEIDTLLKNKAEAFSSTIYMLILAAYKITLSLKTGLEDIPVIAPFVDRNFEVEPILLGNFNYNLLCETKIEDSMTLSEVMNSVKNSVIGMVGYNGQSRSAYINDVDELTKHAAFSWEVSSELTSNDGIFVIVDPKNDQTYTHITAEPLFIRQESSPFLLNLVFKRDKKGQLYGSFIFDDHKISTKKIENIYIQFYKILFVLLNNHSLTILDLKNIYMVDTILTYQKDSLKENSFMDLERSLRKAVIQY